MPCIHINVCCLCYMAPFIHYITILLILRLFIIDFSNVFMACLVLALKFQLHQLIHCLAHCNSKFALNELCVRVIIDQTIFHFGLMHRILCTQLFITLERIVRQSLSDCWPCSSARPVWVPLWHGWHISTIIFICLMIFIFGEKKIGFLILAFYFFSSSSKLLRNFPNLDLYLLLFTTALQSINVTRIFDHVNPHYR